MNQGNQKTLLEKYPPRKCGYCLKDVKGGTSILRDGKKIFFDSSVCLDRFEKENKIK